MSRVIFIHCGFFLTGIKHWSILAQKSRNVEQYLFCHTMPKKEDIEPVWTPQLGPQTDAIRAKWIANELFFGGSRGVGKTQFLLGDFAQDVDKGRKWRGVLFRRTYPELEDIVEESKQIYERAFPGAAFRESDYVWKFPGGASLKFRHLDRDSDADKHLGANYTWIGWDQLELWPTDTPYKKLLGTLRSRHKNIAQRVRSTGNPGGVGTGWIKKRFIDPAPEGRVLLRDKRSGMTRLFVPGRVTDNRILLENDPGYVGRLKAACAGNLQLLRAWLLGDWNVFFGQFFTAYDKAIHFVDPYAFLEPYGGVVPPHWRLEGGLDYGESNPTAFGLWATNEQDESYCLSIYKQAGLWLNEHAAGIEALCRHCEYTNGRMPSAVWCDPQIFYTRASANASSLHKMASDVFMSHGLKLKKSNRDRINGWRFVKNQLAWKKHPETGELIQRPKLYCFNGCEGYEEFERTMLESKYAGDESRPSEDLDTDGDDHFADGGLRYFVMGAKKANPLSLIKRETGMSANYVFKRNKRIAQGYSVRREVPMITAYSMDDLKNLVA